MATYVNDLRLKEIATGDEAGTWGTSTNTNLELIGEALGYGSQNCFAGDVNTTTTVADGASDPARAMYFRVTSSATLTGTRTLTIAPNTISRVMLIENATTGGQSLTISQGSGGNVTIANGAVKMVYLDGAGAGAAVVDALADLELGTITVSDLTATTADINGGTIDGATIGGASAGAGTFTNLTATGTTTLAGASTTANITFGDNDKAIFGAGSDLEIYSDGTQSIIQENGPGALYIQGTHLNLNNAAGTSAYITAVDGGAVTLFSAGSAKLATTASGIDVTGTITADNAEIGTGGASDANAIIDLTGDTTYTDFGFRIIRNSGANGRTDLRHRGTGNFTIEAVEAAAITFETSDTERMRIDSAGNLLVNTTSGASGTPKISVNGSVQTLWGNYRVGTVFDNSFRQGMYFDSTNRNMYLFSTTSDTGGNIVFSTRNAAGASDSDYGTERMRITSAGNVGIGTTSPEAPLDAEGAGALVANFNGTNANGGYVRFQNSSTSIGDIGAGAQVFSGGTAGDFGITSRSGNLVLGTGSTERMRIDTSGNLDLGTTASTDRYQNIVATSAKLSFNAGTGFTGSAATSIYNQSAIPLVFGTNNAERARIDSSGNLLVGITGLSSGMPSTTGMYVEANQGNIKLRAGGGNTVMQFAHSSAVSVVGSITVTASATTYNTSSDARLKENIADAEDASSLVDAIKVRKFDWKADGSHQKYGMVAQELLEVAPEAVHQPDDPEEMMGVDYSKLVPMLVKEIQSLRARVAQLEGA